MSNYSQSEITRILRVELNQRIELIHDERVLKDMLSLTEKTHWRNQVEVFLVNKARVDLDSVSMDSKGQTQRCVKYILSNENDEIIKFFITNLTFKPAGINTMVQLSYLCQTEWIDKADAVLEIILRVKSMKIKERQEYLDSVGSSIKNTPLNMIEFLLIDELGLSLFATRSQFYNGSHIKNVMAYDAEATLADEAQAS